MEQDNTINVVSSQSQKECPQAQISKVQAVYTRDNNNSSEYWKKVLNGEKAPVCWHKKECVKRKVTNENNPKLGRYFYTCSNPKGLNNAQANLNDPEDKNQCYYFLWEEDLQNPEKHPRAPTWCHCNLLAKRCRVKKEGDNFRRSFWGCSKPQMTSCKFFSWAETKVENKETNKNNDETQENNSNMMRETEHIAKGWGVSDI